MNEQSGNSGQLPPGAGSGGDARFYAHPSGDGAICRSGSTTRLCLDELLAALNSVAARQPVGVEPVAVVGGGFTLFWAGSGPIAPLVKRHGIKVGSKLYAAPPAQADRMAIKMLVAAGFVSEDKANESLRIAHGFGGDLGQPAPAAVPVDGLQHPILRKLLQDEREKLERSADRYDTLGPAERLESVQKKLRDVDAAIAALDATHPQPAAAKDGDA